MDTNLLGETLPRRLFQISSQPPDETNNEVNLLLGTPQMGQAVHDHAHLAGVHHIVTGLSQDGFQGTVEVFVDPSLELGASLWRKFIEPGFHKVFDLGVFITGWQKKQRKRENKN